jgi:hypothetical protein
MGPARLALTNHHCRTRPRLLVAGANLRALYDRGCGVLRPIRRPNGVKLVRTLEPDVIVLPRARCRSSVVEETLPYAEAEADGESDDEDADLPFVEILKRAT